MPPEPGVAQLRSLIEAVAAGSEPVERLIADFGPLHEAIERRGRPDYGSREEARLIWDVLWILQFYSPDPAAEANPREWHGAEVVAAEVRRVAERLRHLRD
jgi:hypothetical protein